MQGEFIKTTHKDVIFKLLMYFYMTLYVIYNWQQSGFICLVILENKKGAFKTHGRSRLCIRRCIKLNDIL